MKRLYFILTLILASHYVYAQVGEKRTDLMLGFNAGLSVNSVSFDPTIKQAQHIGPTFGVTLRYVCEKYFKAYCALQVELNYTQMGWKEEVLNGNGEPIADKYQRNLGYLQLPIFARLAWGKERKGFQFFIQAGPQIGYLLNDADSRSDTWTLTPDGVPDRPNNVYQQYDMKVQRKFDYGIAVGLGIDLNSKIGHFTLEGRYYFGLGDMFDNSKKDVFERSANRNIVVKFSYLYDIKKTRL